MSGLTSVLNTSHKREHFSCGNASLDHYLKTQARQDLKNKVAVCFILSDTDKNIKGYFTLSSGSIPRSQIPSGLKLKLPKYKELPVTLLGRLAVDLKYQGQGMGQFLLVDALKKSYEAAQSIGSLAVIVDPIDSAAISFYQKFGFVQLPDSQRMLLAMETLKMLF